MQLKSMVTSGDPTYMFNNMMNTNPQFRQFIETNRGKTIEQVAQENGIDINALKHIM